MLHVSFNNEQRTIGYGWHQNHEAKLKIVEGDLSGSNHQDLDPTIHYITSVIVPSPFVLYWWENKQVTLKLCPDLYQWDTSPYRYTGKRKQTNEQHQILSENLKYYFWLFWYTYSDSEHRFELVVFLASCQHLKICQSDKTSFWLNQFQKKMRTKWIKWKYQSGLLSIAACSFVVL